MRLVSRVVRSDVSVLSPFPTGLAEPGAATTGGGILYASGAEDRPAAAPD